MTSSGALGVPPKTSRAFILTCHSSFRPWRMGVTLLLAAARAGKLSDEGALLSDFVEKGQAAATAEELDARDEQDLEEDE